MKLTIASSSASERPRLPTWLVFMLSEDSGGGQAPGRPERRVEMPDAEPFNLERFVTPQAPLYSAVLDELTAGRKRTHWM